MEWIIQIEGMRCGHCEKKVRERLETLVGPGNVLGVDCETGLCRIAAEENPGPALAELFNGRDGYRLASCGSGKKEEEKSGDGCCCIPDGESDCGCGHKLYRTEEEKRALQNRLRRIEGQIRGLESMLCDNAYCIDLLNQVSAVNSALNSFAKQILFHHIQSCVVEDVQAGKEDKLEELLQNLPKWMK